MHVAMANLLMLLHIMSMIPCWCSAPTLRLPVATPTAYALSLNRPNRSHITPVNAKRPSTIPDTAKKSDSHRKIVLDTRGYAGNELACHVRVGQQKRSDCERGLTFKNTTRY